MARIRPWKLLASEFIIRNRWYTLRKDTVALPDGRTLDDYFVSVRPEVVLVFPVTPEDEVIFVRQYKHGAGKVLIEFPGGVFDHENESAREAASRELREETGFVAGELEFLGAWYDDATKQNNRLHMFLAREARREGAQELDEFEDIEVVSVPLAEVRGMAMRGEIAVAGSVTLAWMGLNALGK